ncbi:MAG: hypothetical protein LAN37_07810 [Acidobacteriia bacterium]|nr:hypothetical protein [Terriglobia bacterium]
MKVDLDLRSVSGSLLYSFRCRSGESGDAEFDFSGDFQCWLRSLTPDDVYIDLFTYEPLGNLGIESRARFFSEELLGRCADYPEYGRIRTFRVRGMVVRLALSHVRFVLGRRYGRGKRIPLVHSFDLEVGVVPDDRILSAIDEDVPFAPPPFKKNSGEEGGTVSLNCDKVDRRHVPGVSIADKVNRYGLAPPYPRVAPAEFSVVLPKKGSRSENPSDFSLTLRDDAGNPAYDLACSVYTIPYGGGFTIIRSGIDCKLFTTPTTVDLLEDSRDPYSRMPRAIILPMQLYGKCSAYPDWGARRTFSLRGFRLIMEFRDIVFAEGATRDDFWLKRGINQVTMTVKIEPDPSATTPVAAPSHYADWGFVPGRQPCERVLINPEVSHLQ